MTHEDYIKDKFKAIRECLYTQDYSGGEEDYLFLFNSASPEQFENIKKELDKIQKSIDTILDIQLDIQEM